jgi:hypothetical protein
LKVRPILIAVALMLSLSIAFFIHRRSPNPASREAEQPSSARAFAATYLDVVAGRPIGEQRSCTSCHEERDAEAPGAWDFLSARLKWTSDEWAGAIQLRAKCGACHVTPDPRTLPWKSWNEALHRMDQIMAQKGVARLTEEERRDLVHYYYAFSPERLPPLADDPDPKLSPVQFDSTTFGNGLGTNQAERPFIGHVQVTDLDQDGRPDVLVCDSDKSAVSWIRQKVGRPGQPAAWHEELLAKVPSPARTAVFTNRATGRLEIVVACQERMEPTDDLIGSVALFRNDSAILSTPQFTPITILSNIGRVAGVEPGDFNNDGEVDFVVAAFGHITTGEVGLLQRRDANYSYERIVKRSGAIRARPIDLNGDGRLDFVVLFGQEHEQISAFLNNGKTAFTEVVLFKAGTPSFGSSGMELVDLDQDGDTDILYTNGDNMDLATRFPRPYHGIQWLENRGNLQFEYHDIVRFYGAYCALPADLNQDGHLDIVATSLFNDWRDPSRASLIWLENNGRQKFTPHAIARQPIQLISAAAADFNHDTSPELIASGMHIFPPFERTGRVTLWTTRTTWPGRPLR